MQQACVKEFAHFFFFFFIFAFAQDFYSYLYEGQTYWKLFSAAYIVFLIGVALVAIILFLGNKQRKALGLFLGFLLGSLVLSSLQYLNMSPTVIYISCIIIISVIYIAAILKLVSLIKQYGIEKNNKLLWEIIATFILLVFVAYLIFPKIYEKLTHLKNETNLMSNQSN